MKALMLLLPIVFSVDPSLVVSTLNFFYSEISGSDTALYSLVSSLYPQNSSSEYDPCQVLLLNNTFKGLSLHTFELNASSPYPNIINHTVPQYNLDSSADSLISKALLSYLKATEITLSQSKIFKQEIPALNIFFYQTRLVFNNSEYVISVLKQENTTTQYITQQNVFEIPIFVQLVHSKVQNIIVAMCLGVLLTFFGLCAFYKKNQRLPFTTKDEARTGFNMENIKNST